jgi:hypothetical protein
MMEEESSGLESPAETTTTTVQILVDTSWIELPYYFVRDLWRWSKATMGCYLTFFLFEPIMDPTSLIDLSIGLILLERVGANLQPHEEVRILTEKMILEHVQHRQTVEMMEVEEQAVLYTLGLLLGSPIMTLFASTVLIFSFVVANSNYNSSLLAPLWFRIFTRQRSTTIMYILLALFCLESILILAILLLACHALVFPQYLEEHIAVLFTLTGVWILSLMASSVVRYNLYQSIGN